MPRPQRKPCFPPGGMTLAVVWLCLLSMPFPGLKQQPSVRSVENFYQRWMLSFVRHFPLICWSRPFPLQSVHLITWTDLFSNGEPSCVPSTSPTWEGRVSPVYVSLHVISQYILSRFTKILLVTFVVYVRGVHRSFVSF